MEDEQEKFEREEQKYQAKRWERAHKTKSNEWFDSDNYIDVIDWYLDNDEIGKAYLASKEGAVFYPNDGDIISRYVNLLASTGKFSEGYEVSKKFLETNDSAEVRLEMAACMFELDYNLKTCEEIFLKSIEEDSDDYFPFFVLGKLYLKTNHYIKAEKYLRAAILLYPDNEEIFNHYLRCLDSKQARKKVNSFLKNFTQTHPFIEKGWYCYGISSFNCADIDSAIKAYNYALAINPQNAYTHVLKSDCYKVNGDYVSAIHEVETAMNSIGEEDANLRATLGRLYFKIGSFKKAISHLKYARKHHNDVIDVNYLLDLAMCYIFCGDTQNGVISLEDALRYQVTNITEIVHFASNIYSTEYKEQSEAIFSTLLDDYLKTSDREIVACCYAALKSNDGEKLEAIKIMEETAEECGQYCEDMFWISFLLISCTDKKYDSYTKKAIIHLKHSKHFKQIIKRDYPELLENPNYIRCIKEIGNA